MDSTTIYRGTTPSIASLYCHPTRNVMTDPDTGVQYIVNDRGGMCLRENPDEF